MGFKGADCEKATPYLGEALDVARNRVRKPEFHQRQQRNINKGWPDESAPPSVRSFRPRPLPVSELIDLASIGSLEREPGSTIEFNEEQQKWEVRGPSMLRLVVM